MGNQLQAQKMEASPEPWMLDILKFCEWEDRRNTMMMNKNFSSFAKEEAFYRWMCQRLAEESYLQIPSKLPVNVTWKKVFLELFKLRKFWHRVEDDIAASSSRDRFKINVYARFRPTSNDNDASEGAEVDGNVADVEVTLPLHQRLSMIKMSHKLKSNREALKLLAVEGGWFQNKWKNLASGEGKENMLNIECNETNKTQGYNPSLSGVKVEKTIARVESIDPKTKKVVVVAPDIGLREFSYDDVFSDNTSQSKVYDEAIYRLINDCINGYNATAIVYGQTGAGKSYTMFGADDDSIYGNNMNGKGIIPRVCCDVLEAVHRRRIEHGMEANILVSYVEIFGDYVTDLLRNGQRCGHSKVAAQRYVLSGAAETPVDSIEDMYNVLRRGEAQKRRAATAMNDRSTRAHALFILRLEQINPRTGVSRSSKLFLADLGGSEQVKKSQVEAGQLRLGADANFSTGFEMHDRMREAVYINLGLLALKKCIEALNNRAPYVPYQDSKLTMLLSDGIGGNSKTSVIVCSRTESAHIGETVATLRFGERCALIETEVDNNASLLAGVLSKIDEQIKELEAIIKGKERWMDVEVRREDLLAEEGTMEKAQGVERIIVTKLVGAETERKQLEALLKKRAQYAGSDVFEKESNAKKSVAFGKELAEMYGIGAQYDQASEMVADNERFRDIVDSEQLPAVLRAMGQTKGWATGEAIAENAEKLEKRAIKANRNKLRYAGLSL